jgi:hypothetical protein
MAASYEVCRHAACSVFLSLVSVSGTTYLAGSSGTPETRLPIMFKIKYALIMFYVKKWVLNSFLGCT